MEIKILNIIKLKHFFRILINCIILIMLFMISNVQKAYAGDTYKADMQSVLKEYHAEKLRYIDNVIDLVNYMYESFLLGRGIVVAYTGTEDITITDIDGLMEQVIQIDKPTLRDCEALWGNIDGYGKAVSKRDDYLLICISPVYRHTQKELRQLDQILDNVADTLIGENADQTREEKIRAVHDYIIDSFDYDVSLKNYDEYDGFFHPINGKKVMVCQGYSLLTYKLLNKMEIPCKIIMSNSHSWNIVQLENGYWYHLDCTNDDTEVEANKYNNFLKPELEGDIYQYLPSCALYENLDGYIFGNEEYKNTIWIRTIWGSVVLIISLTVCVLSNGKKNLIRKEKIEKKKKFEHYNKVVI